MIRVGIVGHGPHTIPIADSLERQPDLVVVGAYDHDGTPFSKSISKRMGIFCSESGLERFKERGIKVHGFLDDFIEETDAFLEYDADKYTVRISYGSSGMVIGPYEVLLERLSMVLPIDDISFREMRDELFCCPYFRIFQIGLKLREKLGVEEIRESLLSSSRIVGISSQGVSLQDLCAFLPTSIQHSIFSMNALLGSISVEGKGARFTAMLGYLLPLPEVIDTLRESEGVRREFSRPMTDEHLNIKGGLLV